MPENSKNIMGQITIPFEIVHEGERELNNIPSLSEKIKSSFDKDISKTLEIIMAGSLFCKASDIHVEPEEDGTKIRIRLDGILHDLITVNRDVSRRLTSRIKLLSKVKLNVEDRPQDGRFTVILPFKNNPLEIEIRMSALPSEYGETLVLRLLDPRKLIVLEDLGLRKDLFQIFKTEIEKPNGMVIVTGPTGSGKTTTLYAFLKTINKPGVKIITIEDPVEYHLEGISQTEVNPERGYDFASGLRAIVRQDPDVVLVGEIRDLETAQIGMQASLTGHLVFSTLHTNDAPGAIARLIAIGETMSSIGPAINMVIAQRLIRKVCQNCVKIEAPDPSLVDSMKKELETIKEDIFSFPTSIEIPVAVGCKECSFTGYSGRIGIFEAFLLDEEMEEHLYTSPPISETRKLAIKKGMTTIRQDGIIKVLEKKTTIEEIERVT
jgi:type II secretory ATPase GspE/PulE/Tfp pilus assembly ATPase PilB-like protein